MTPALLSDGGLWERGLGTRRGWRWDPERMRSNPARAPAQRVAGASTLRRRRAGEAGPLSRLPSRTYPRLDTLRLNLAFPQSGQEEYLSGPAPPLGSARGRLEPPFGLGRRCQCPVPRLESVWTSPRSCGSGRQRAGRRERNLFPESH